MCFNVKLAKIVTGGLLLNTDNFCQCGSAIEYARCCGPFHFGEKKPLTAEALMRARFTAYALHDGNYLLDTWDATVRPKLIDFSQEKICWQQLKISNTKKGGINDTKGVVEFKAYYLLDGEEHVMNEISQFIKRADDWFYLDGLIKFMGKVAHQTNFGKNSLCSCGSGKKFKRCCGTG
jgi:SEC-C motif-containing protein